MSGQAGNQAVVQGAHSDSAVLRLMETMGGSFVSALATAWMRADPTNQALLMGAFADLYQRYAGMALGAGATPEPILEDCGTDSEARRVALATGQYGIDEERRD